MLVVLLSGEEMMHGIGIVDGCAYICCAIRERMRGILAVVAVLAAIAFMTVTSDMLDGRPAS